MAYALRQKLFRTVWLVDSSVMSRCHGKPFDVKLVKHEESTHFIFIVFLSSTKINANRYI